jgi:hypothetical protein
MTKQQPLIEGVDYYYNEDGYVVLTAKYHLEKGFCCGNGCRHCPYDFENVPEPKRSDMIKQYGNQKENPRP